MNRPASSTAIALAIATLVSMHACGQSDESAVPPFADLDIDRSGSISEDEAATYTALKEVFSAVDMDRDSKLTEREYADAIQYYLEKS